MDKRFVASIAWYCYFSILLIACNNTSELNTEIDLNQLTETYWVLESINGNSVEEGSFASIEFREREISGSASCSIFVGTISTNNNSISIPDLTLSGESCEYLDQEVQFIELLGNVNSFDQSENSLALQTDSGELVFSMAGNSLLENSDWTLVGISNGNAFATSIWDNEIKALFSDGLVTGNSACNPYSAGYSTTGSKFELDSLIFERSLCAEPDRNSRDTEYFAAIEQATHFQLTSTTLIFYNDRDELLLSFKAN